MFLLTESQEFYNGENFYSVYARPMYNPQDDTIGRSM